MKHRKLREDWEEKLAKYKEKLGRPKAKATPPPKRIFEMVYPGVDINEIVFLKFKDTVDSNENDLMRFYVNHDKNTTTTKRKNDRH
jgi:hypothetical protein